MTYRITAFVLLLTAFVTACTDNSGPPLVASNVEIYRPMPGRHMSAGYLEIANNSGQAIRLTRVESPDFAAVEMHETRMEDGVARMRPLADLVIDAGATVRFEPGGKHLMLMRPSGTPDRVNLEFYADDTLILSIEAEFASRGD